MDTPAPAEDPPARLREDGSRSHAPLTVVGRTDPAGASSVRPLPSAVWRARSAAPQPYAVPDRDPRGPFAWVLPRRVLAGLDVLAAGVALLTSWAVLPDGVRGDSAAAGVRSVQVGALASVAALTLVLSLVSGGYSSRHRIARVDEALLLLRNVGLATLSVIALAVLAGGSGVAETGLSRAALLADCLALLCLMGAARLAMWWWQRAMFRRGEGVRRVVVAGAGAAAHAFETFLEARRWLGVRCAGACEVLGRATELQRQGGLPSAAPLLGGLDDLVHVVAVTGADEVIVALDDDELVAFPPLARTLAHAGVRFRVLPEVFEVGYPHARAAGLNGLPTVHVEGGLREEAQRAAKRVGDVVLSAAVLIVLAPLLALVAVLVKATSSGPVVFRQERVGRDGRHFRMVKFRSMYVDAEACLDDVDHLNEADGALFKIKDDPRVTPVGRLLRRWSIDELPQFWNVLRGDMSVVGPRPPLPREVRMYETAHLSRLKGKPGITGLWQVSGRSELTFEQMVDCDRHYLEHWSLGLDLSIIVRTVVAILRRDGAY